MVNPHIATAFLVASDRSEPEDVVRVVQNDVITAFVVADGAGGLAGGARAAHLVVESFVDVVEDLASADAAPEHWCEFLRRVDDRLFHDTLAGESTGVVGVVRDRVVIGASVGDHQAWLVTGDSYQVLTSAQQRQRLGSGRATPVAFEASLATGSVILTATDGLFGAVPAAAILAALRTAPAPEKLVSLARSRSGKLYDDVGIAIVSVT